MGMSQVFDSDNNAWNVVDVAMGDLHTGARFTKEINYDRAIVGAVYEVVSAPDDNDHGWVYVHDLDEGDDPLQTQDGCLSSDGFFSSDETTAVVFHFVDPEFYTEPIVHGAQLALALHALSYGVWIDDDGGTVWSWWNENDTADGKWVTVPDYGVRALNYAEEHGLAVNINPGSSDAALTDAGQELLGTLRVGYWKALQAGWTDVPAQ